MKAEQAFTQSQFTLTWADIAHLDGEEQISAVIKAMPADMMRERIANLPEWDAYDVLATVDADLDPVTLKAWAVFGEALAKSTGRTIVSRGRYGNAGAFSALKPIGEREHAAARREVSILKQAAE